MEINYRDRKNTMRKLRNLKRHNYSELSIDDKISLFQLEEDLEGNKKTLGYYESKNEKKRRLRHSRRRK